jgi:hypothetical protein
MMDAASISLREHLEARIGHLEALTLQRIGAAERAVLIAMDAANKAIGKQEDGTDRRFAAVNEFRATLNDMIGRMMPRSESEQRHAITAEKLDAIDTRLTRIEGAGVGVRGAWGVLLGLVGAAIGAAGIATALLR